MLIYLSQLFDTSGFPPRWQCGSWTPVHGWLHILSDLGIWLAYLAIPCILGYFVLRRKDIPFRPIFWLFAAFILACGTTHLMEAIIFWWPAYRLAGVIKLLTAMVSWGTVMALVPATPIVLAMRSAEELQREISARRVAEDSLRRANFDLERQVEERTAELARANSTLRYEREWLRTTLDSIGDAVMATDTDGRVTLMNRVAESLTGWSSGDAVGQSLEKAFNIIIETTGKVAESPVARVLLGGTARGSRNRTILMAKDGTKRSIDENTAPIRSEDGNLIGAVLVFQDITERKRAEDEIRDRAARLRAIVDTAVDGIITFDSRGLVDSFNPAAERMFGYGSEEVVGQNVSMLVPAAYQEEQDGHLSSCLVTGLSKIIGIGHEVVGRRKDGSTCPLELAVSEMSIGDRRMFTGIVRDISDRKLAEVALKLVEARYNSLVASTGVIVWEMDLDGVLVSLSLAFETITGWSRSDWIGRRFDDLIHPEDHESARRWHDRVRQGETLPRFELRVRIQTGDHVTCEFLLVTKIREDSEDRILVITRDITEQKRMERALEQSESIRRAKEAAEQASRAKSEFLSNVSHGLRTPLTAILGFTELLEEHTFLQEGPSEIQGYLGIMRENGHVLLALIDDLLDISRIEAGQLHIKHESCSLAQLLSDVVDSLRAQAEAKQLRLETEFLSAIPQSITTDRLRFQQILMNLLDNAIKFTEQGRIRLTAQTIDRPGSDRSLRFEVSDTGIGMTAEEISGLFQPFYRVRSAAPGGPAGTGLGLAICKILAKRLGGEITVWSTPKVGTTFTLTIPADLPEDVAQFQEPSRLPGPLSFKPATSPTPRLRGRILLAEDNDANQQLVGLRLNGAGAEVVAARNGKEVLDRVRDGAEQGQPIDAVIMDMNMPVIDGYEAVRQLRASGFTAPILAVTAYAMSEDRDECLGLGCDDYMSKPIEWDLFFRKLTELLAGASGLSSQG